MCWDGSTNNYKQVREPLGGGTRKIYVPVNANKEFLIQKAISLFFPNGKCKQLNIEDYHVDLFNSQHERVEESATIHSILMATALQKLRFYLATRPKKPETMQVESDMSSDDSDELVSYNYNKSVPKQRTTENENSTVEGDDSINSEINSEQHLDGGESVDYQSHFTTSTNNVDDLSSEFTVLVNSILDGYSTNQNEMKLEVATDPFPVDVPSSINDEVFFPSDNSDIVSEETEPQTFDHIVELLKKSINHEKSNTFNVFRDEIFNCCVRAMRRQTFSPFNKMFVKFSDIEGLSEGAIDEGGPTRELFRLVLNYIKDSQMFTGNCKKHITLNAAALEAKHYYEAGRLSLIHGGPAPHFFSNLFFSLISGEENAIPTFEDVDNEIKLVLQHLQDTENLAEAQNLITDTSIFSTAGYNFIFDLREKTDIIQGTLKFYAVTRIKDTLYQFIDGLKTCQVYDYLKKFPNLFKSQMCDDAKNLSAEDFEKLFEIVYSSIGSNTRAIENKVIAYFRDYLLDCEMNSENTLEQENSGEENVTLKNILVFATGADEVPPLGFPVMPKITFLHEDSSIYPKANTCALELKLPVVNKIYEDFKKAMNFGIANCNSFGFA